MSDSGSLSHASSAALSDATLKSDDKLKALEDKLSRIEEQLAAVLKSLMSASDALVQRTNPAAGKQDPTQDADKEADTLPLLAQEAYQ